MKILILHNAYYNLGGEDVVVELESRLLSEAGHDVYLEITSNKTITTFGDKVEVFWNAPYNKHAANSLALLVARISPDVVHIHNFFPLLSPSVHEAAFNAGIAIVQTLHNFRVLCVDAKFLRNGQICEKCIGGQRYWGAVHRCYKGSLAGSIAAVRMQNRAFGVRAWHRYVHRFIALSRFSRRKFIEGGLPADRISVKYNFTTDLDWDMEAGAKKSMIPGALFVGRLSREKGVEHLLEAWRWISRIPLRIVGDGPDRAILESKAPANVEFLGQRSNLEVVNLMRQASCVVVPSICYENFPMTVAEAYSAGVPVLASRIGALAEIVTDGVNGIHFNPGDAQDLAAAVNRMFSEPQALARMAVGARQTYEANLTPKVSLVALEEIYGEALAASRRADTTGGHAKLGLS